MYQFFLLEFFVKYLLGCLVCFESGDIFGIEERIMNMATERALPCGLDRGWSRGSASGRGWRPPPLIITGSPTQTRAEQSRADV